MTTPDLGPDRAGEWPDKPYLDDQLAKLKAEHPGYTFWLSRHQNMVVATRIDGAVGVDRTLVEDDIPRMRAQLERQADRASRRAVPINAGRTF